MPKKIRAENNKTQQIEANCVAEMACISEKTYSNPFVEVALDAVITAPDKTQVRAPAFWAGGNHWCFRYASSVPGVYNWQLDCSDTANSDIHGVTGKIEVVPYQGDNELYTHGPLQIAEDRRHFEHIDGTPFFWLGDTWWKNLCKRLTWNDFQDLAYDRKAKGFNLIQIVCGPYPDENMFESRWENEGGKPYESKDFSIVNPTYFEYADRRIEHLVDTGLVPAIVGGWGRPQAGGESTIAQVGLEGYKRHWRHLIARYGAYPVVWIVGGEAKDKQGPWSEAANYLKSIDPYQRPLTYHAPGNPREAIGNNAVFDFDMIAIGHDGYKTANQTFKTVNSCLNHKSSRPVLCGEACYEGHMQRNFQHMQRYLFWSLMLSGAAGHTYGAAGIWHASVEGDPGITPVYDWTTWKEGMIYPGALQLGLGKELLEKYPWSRFEPHPEWVEEDCFAGGIPGEVRVIYMPLRKIYDWSGPKVKNLDPHVTRHAYYFDPVTGRTFEQGKIEAASDATEKATNPFVFQKDVPSPQDWVLVFERLSQRPPLAI
mgnify:CR=1 FL=1